MSIINLGIFNNSDVGFSEMYDKYFTYLDFSKISNTGYNGLNLKIEYLELCNTFNEYTDYFVLNNYESFSFDDFIEFKLSSFLSENNNSVKVFNEDESFNNPLESLLEADYCSDSVDYETMASCYDAEQYCYSKQSNLDCWFENQQSSDVNSIEKVYNVLTSNFEFNFVMACYNYAKKVLPKYRSKYSKKNFTQHQLFAIYAYKLYHNNKYRENMESLELSDKLIKALNLKKIPHFTTLQKFFKKLETKYIRDIDKILNSFFPPHGCLFELDGSGMTNNYSDTYYNRRTKKTKRKYIKNHITIDSKYMLIRHSNAMNGSRHDTIFAISAINSISKYNPRYVLADKAYDSEEIRKTINEETTGLAQIPVKANPKTGKHRLNSEAVFRTTIYRFRNYVECVFSILKRKFSGINTSRSTKLGIKETKLKNLCYNIYRTIQLIIGIIKPHPTPM